MRCGLDAVAALRTAFLVSAAALFGCVYYYALGLASRRRAALAAAVACVLPGAVFPGPARGMYPAFLALAFTAVLFGALDRLARSGSRGRLAAFGAATGLILTHSLTAYMLLWIVLVGSWQLAPLLGRRGLVRGAAAAVAALAVTAWFWGPMLLVSSEAQTSYLAEAHPYAASLLGGEARAETPLEKSWSGLNGIGKVIAMAQLLLAAALAWSLRGVPKTPSMALLPSAALFVLAASVEPPGGWLTGLWQFDKLQFAWRWQGPLAVLCAGALAAVPRGRRTLPTTLAVLIVLGFLLLVTPAERPWQDPQSANRVYDPEEFEHTDPGTRAMYLHNRIEMRPLGADRRLYPPGTPGRVQVVDGQGSVVAETIEPSRRIYHIRARSTVTLLLATYCFRGWRAWLDGQPIELRCEPQTGLQLLSAPVGDYRLEVEYRRF